MQRLKIFGGTGLLCIILIILMFLNTDSVVKLKDSQIVLSTVALQQNIVDLKAVSRYNSRQDELNNALNDYFIGAIRSGKIVGAGISIVKGDSILFSDGFGKRNIKEAKPVDGETIFRLGSLSKGFAGVLVENLKAEGKLAWEDKILDYIPEFRLGDVENTAEITLAHILSHTTGAPYHSFTNLIEVGMSIQDIAMRFKEVLPVSKPGEMYSYQNAIFSLCQEVILKTTGNKINTVLKNEFFMPLDMHNASTDYVSITQADNVAMPHTKWRKRYKSGRLTDKYYNAVAAGGVNASASDMAKWMRFLLGHNPEVMSPSAIEEVFTPFVEHKGRTKYYQRWPGHIKSYYGFGWRIHKMKTGDGYTEQTIWHHGGSVNNYRNEIALYPDADIGICVLLNSNSRLAKTVIPDLYTIVKRIYRITSEKLIVENSADVLLENNY